MKKYISCLLVLLALVLPGLVMEADAAGIVGSGTCGENVTWVLDSEGLLAISGTGDMFNYWNDSPWYAIRTAVKTVLIENGVTTIGNSAFEGCSRLESITIPDGVTAIGVCAFEHCSILVSIAIPDSVTTIGNYAFNGCDNLESITIPDCVTAIGNYAFNGCSDLESISIGDGVTTIGDFAFEGCSRLESITIGDGVVTIGNRAFSRCYKLKSITIPDSVATIGDSAFSSCNSLVSISVPESVITIGDGSFSYCSRLCGIYVDVNNPSYSSDEYGVLFDKNKMMLIQAPGGISGDYQIPTGVTTIDDKAFSDCYSLTSVIIPDGVATIGNIAFSHCYSMENIAIPDSVTAIGDSAFWDCGGLTTVHYGGTEGQRANISVDILNWDLENAIWHYECDGASCSNPFVDVAEDAYYSEPVLWAVRKGITNGMSENSFAPEATCTRGQIVTFLWRACGSPEPESSSNPFWDVSSSDYFYKAVLWAVENGITSGMGDGSFAPGAPCTRGQVATFLWRACGQPASGASNIFTDIVPGSYYYNAVLWAVENGITNGVGEGTFAPDATCTRGQIVTFLYRAMA